MRKYHEIPKDAFCPKKPFIKLIQNEEDLVKNDIKSICIEVPVHFLYLENKPGAIVPFTVDEVGTIRGAKATAGLYDVYVKDIIANYKYNSKCYPNLYKTAKIYISYELYKIIGGIN